MAWLPVHDEFTIDDIGARLLANLARGIYNHEAVLREYVQNARDAYLDLATLPQHAAISIRIVNDSTITIHDDGIGMDEANIKACKRIAVSPKAGLDNRAGFRGIGIWAGFQACDQLELETTKQGSPHRYRLQIDFAEILKHVDEDINIKTLLDQRFRIQKDPAPKDEHWTQVKLIGLQGDYRRLTDRQELERIASQVLPCKIDPTFSHAEPVNEWLADVEGYQDFTVLVEGGEVFRQFPEGLQAPKHLTLEKDGEEYGVAWYCTGSRSISPTRNEHRSFRLRAQNFAVGRAGIFDDEDGAAFGIINKIKLGSATHLNWHVGEIHITHPELRPDTPRSSLELDSIARRAIETIRGFYEDRIADSRAGASYNTYRRLVDECAAALNAGTPIASEQIEKWRGALEDSEKLTKERAPGDKVKRRLRSLVNKAENKSERKRLLKELHNLGGKKVSPSKQAEPKTTTGQASKAKNSGKQSATSLAGDAEKVDVEKLMSDIFDAVQQSIGDDPELVAVVCEAIERIFKSHAMINNA